MSLCARCRLGPAHRLLRPAPGRRPRTASSLSAKRPPPSVHEMLSTPTWSVRSLRDPEPSSSTAAADQPPPPPVEPISPAQLQHLLRLAGLPLAKSEQQQEAMIATLQSQLRFVRAIQAVDTAGVEPLAAIRDETDEGVAERTVGLADVRHALDKEVPVGHYQRPTRVREKIRSDAEDWDTLATASRKAGKYFVVDSGSGGKGAS